MPIFRRNQGLAIWIFANPRKGAAQNLRGGRALAEQILRGGAVECEELGGF